MADAGLIVLTSFISPFRAERAAVRTGNDGADGEFFEVFVDVPLEDVAEGAGREGPLRQGARR